MAIEHKMNNIKRGQEYNCSNCSYCVQLLSLGGADTSFEEECLVGGANQAGAPRVSQGRVAAMAADDGEFLCFPLVGQEVWWCLQPVDGTDIGETLRIKSEPFEVNTVCTHKNAKRGQPHRWV